MLPWCSWRLRRTTRWQTRPAPASGGRGWSKPRGCTTLRCDGKENWQCLNKFMENSCGGDNYKARGCSSLKSDGKDNAVPYLDKFLLAMSPSCPSQEGHIQVGLALICLRLRLSELDRSGTKYLLSYNFSSRQFPCHSLRHVWYRKSFYLKFQPQNLSPNFPFSLFPPDKNQISLKLRGDSADGYSWLERSSSSALPLKPFLLSSCRKYDKAIEAK